MVVRSNIMQRLFLIIIILLFIICVIPVYAATTEATLLWSKDIGYPGVGGQNAYVVDTNSVGNMVIVASGNDSIIGYNQYGVGQWAVKPYFGYHAIKMKCNNVHCVYRMENYNVGIISTSTGGPSINYSTGNAMPQDIEIGSNAWDSFLWGWVANTSTIANINISNGPLPFYNNSTSSGPIWKNIGFGLDTALSKRLYVTTNVSVGGIANSSIWLWYENSTIGYNITFVQNLSLSDGIQTIKCYNTLCTISTDTKVYHQTIGVSGFGTQYSTTSNIGDVTSTALSNYGTSIEARGNNIDIYEYGCSNAGTYSTGDVINSVDISKNGLWAAAGGVDGKLYIFTKDMSSGWVVYYIGSVGTVIKSVAITDDGEYVVVGRSPDANGYSVEYYRVQTPIPPYLGNYTADLFVTKGAIPYTSIQVNITSNKDNNSGFTDSNGKFTWIASPGILYTINLNGGEHIQEYMGSDNYRTISINLPYPLMTRAFQYTSILTNNSKTITTTYTDVNNANVNISIVDVATKVTLYTVGYTGTKSVTNNYVIPDANKSYKTVINFTRTTGVQYSDTIYLQSSIFYAIPKNTSDQYTLFIYAIYTIMLMVVALSIGTQSLKYGTVMLVALTFLGITLGFLPLSLYTVGIATSAFIALLEVYRRRE